MLEVVGVSGVVHLGQIQSGLRQATRIAQVNHWKNKNLLFLDKGIGRQIGYVRQSL